MFCQKCGSKVEDNSLFCPNCGNSIQAQATPVAPIMSQEPVAPTMPQEPVAPTMPQEPVAPTMSQEPVAPMMQQEPVADPYANPIPVMPEQNQWNQPSTQYIQPNPQFAQSNPQFVPNNGMNQNTYGQPVNNMPPKKSKALPIVLSIVAVLLVAAIAIVCIFLLKDDKKDDKKTTKDTTTEAFKEEPTSDDTTTEEPSSDEDETTTKTPVTDGEVTVINRNGTTFSIPAGFMENSSQEDNYIRYDASGTALESFFFSYNDVQSYSEDEVYDAFEKQLENIYGTDYDYNVYTNAEGYEFHHYHYDECSILSGYYADAYVCTDGEKVIYMENVTAIDEPSNIEDIVDSVTME